MVGDLALLGSPVVGEGDEELATRVSEEAVIDVALNVALVPDLGGLPLGVDLGNDLIEVRGRVHVLPDGLAIVRVVTAGIVLLSSVVGEGDTSAGQGEDLSLSQAGLVAAVAVQETSVVVVIDEDTECVNVLEVAALLVVSVPDAIHGLVGTEHVADSVEHRVVEKSGKIVLVGSDVCGISVEVLAHLEDAGSLTVLLPEVLGHLRDSIDADTVEVVGLNDALDPVLKVATYVVVFMVDIGQTGETAVLDRPLVIPVDIAVAVVVLGLVKRVDLAEVITDGSRMVGDHIDHNPDVLFVGGVDESLEVIG